jgi:glutamate carboxypeptidase
MIQALERYLQTRQAEMRADLRQLVCLESPSDDPTSLARCGDFLAQRARGLTDGTVTSIADPAGPHIDVIVGAERVPRVLILGHYDTVWPVGTTAARPYEESGDVARGPGVFDMKAGLVQGLWGVHALAALSGEAPCVRFLLNSDEEAQSTRSRGVIEEAARAADMVLVLEPSLDGALKTARRGSGRFTISIHGRAAHAGLDPSSGRSAIGELGRVIEYLHSLSDAKQNMHVNVGTVSGGTQPNVIAAHARAEVDVRVATPAEASRMETLIRGIRPSRDGIELDVSGGFVRPPMPRTAQIGELFERAQRLAREIGLELHEAAAGGGSDGNFCAALGVPVLDGLGAVGGGAHADDEYVILTQMPARSALVGALVQEQMSFSGRRG